MALLTPISAHFRRSCFSIENPLFQFCFSSLLLFKIRPFYFCSSKRLFSSSPYPLQPDQPDPKTTMSSRISFVFDQIDAIDCKKWGKDEALQRICSWREQKRKNKPDASVLGLGFPGSIESALGLPEKKEGSGFATMEVELVHPWPEWIELMERLVRQNYFDHRRKDEDRMVPDTPPDDDVTGLGFVEQGFDFARDWTTVRNVCLNFGRDRFDILRTIHERWCHVDGRGIYAGLFTKDGAMFYISMNLGTFACIVSFWSTYWS